MENPDTALRVAVNRARAPEGALRTWNAFLVESLADLLGRCASGVIAEDSANDGDFLLDDLTLACRDLAVLEPPNDPIAVAQLRMITPAVTLTATVLSFG